MSEMPTNIHFAFTPTDRAIAKRLLQKCEIATAGLPYTPEFDQLRAEFKQLAGYDHPPQAFWRLLVRVAADGLERRKTGAESC